MATLLRPHDPALVADLGRLLAPERVLFRPIDRLGRSADASLYRLLPRAIGRPRDLSPGPAPPSHARPHPRRPTFPPPRTPLPRPAASDDRSCAPAPPRPRAGGRRRG